MHHVQLSPDETLLVGFLGAFVVILNNYFQTLTKKWSELYGFNNDEEIQLVKGISDVILQ